MRKLTMMSMKKNNKKIWVVFLTTYPPRECGIATFTSDLLKNFDKLYLPRDQANDYLEAAKKLNAMTHVKLVSIQHEFGIFGDNYGQNILVFLDEIKKPV